MNAIRCPKCTKALRERDADFIEGGARDTFEMTCKLCGHKWKAHQRDFFNPDKNPFKPFKDLDF